MSALVYAEPQRPRVVQSPRRGHWHLAETMMVVDGYRRWVVPQGFTCDFASVPRLGRVFAQTTDLGTAGPFAHDYLYRHGGRVRGIDGHWLRYTREDADRIFAALMAEDKVPRWRRVPAYWAVRLGGWAAWKDAPDPQQEAA